MFNLKSIVPLSFILAGGVMLSACQSDFVSPSMNEFDAVDAAAFDARSPVPGNIQAQLARVRNLTAPFHSFEAGTGAGWFAELSECVEHPELGGMGYHYGNPEYLMNGTVEVMQPEVLLYEPMKNGKMRLVGVEYVMPVETERDPETGLAAMPDTPAPVLFDQSFHWNPVLGLWALHVWIWRDNPAGMFADFNPSVSCQFATH